MAVVIASSSTYQNATAAAVHNVTLPTGIQSGDILIAFCCAASGNFAIDTPTLAGFTDFLGNTAHALTAGSGYSTLDNDVAVIGFRREADGTEGTTAAFTFDFGTDELAAVVVRITGGTFSSLSIEDGASGSTGSLNPPSLTPAGGAITRLWLCGGAVDGGLSVTGFPTNYTEVATITAPSQVTATMAERLSSLSSDDPGTFTHSSGTWAALTLSVEEAPTTDQTITGALFSDADTFGAGTVTPGPVTITGTLFVDPDTFGAGTVIGGGQTITGSLFVDPDTFGSGQIVMAGSATPLNLEYLFPLEDFPGDQREHRRKLAQTSRRLIANMQQIQDAINAQVNVPSDVAALQAAVLALQAQADQAINVGEIRDFAGATAPALWLNCDGAAVSRTTYSELFAVIGTDYGAGDGSTTFNLPDLRGRATIGTGAVDGTGTNRALADKGGAETHALTEAELAAHTHGVGTYSVGSNASTIREGQGVPSAGSRNLTAGGTEEDSNPINRNIANNHSHSLSGASGSTGSGTAHNNMQPFLAVNRIIFANA